MENHRVTCEEEGRYVGKYSHSRYSSDSITNSLISRVHA